VAEIKLRHGHNRLMAKPSTPTRADIASGAAVLREVLSLVERGELQAATPQAIALTRRIEGALIALEAVAGDGS